MVKVSSPNDSGRRGTRRRRGAGRAAPGRRGRPAGRADGRRGRGRGSQVDVDDAGADRVEHRTSPGRSLLVGRQEQVGPGRCRPPRPSRRARCWGRRSSRGWPPGSTASAGVDAEVEEAVVAAAQGGVAAKRDRLNAVGRPGRRGRRSTRARRPWPPAELARAARAACRRGRGPACRPGEAYSSSGRHTSSPSTSSTPQRTSRPSSTYFSTRARWRDGTPHARRLEGTGVGGVPPNVTPSELSASTGLTTTRRSAGPGRPDRPPGPRGRHTVGGHHRAGHRLVGADRHDLGPVPHHGDPHVEEGAVAGHPRAAEHLRARATSSAT